MAEAIESILNQTFTDFEFLIIDDGSTDSSLDIIKSQKDSRIRIILNQNNSGLIKSLNKGLELAHGQYIARMDGDDISLPNRLAKQVQFMDDHPKIGVCSAWIKAFGLNSRIWKSPVNHGDICARMFCECSIWHPVSMFRKELFEVYSLCYDESFRHCEDYKLWVDMKEVTMFYNLPEVLLHYRQHSHQVSKLATNVQTIRNILAEDFLGRYLTAHERKCHKALHFGEPFHDLKTIKDIDTWVDYLKEYNVVHNKYAEPAFSNSLCHMKKNMYLQCFYDSIVNMPCYTPMLLRNVFFSKERYFLNLPLYQFFMIVIKSLIFYKNRHYGRVE